MSAASSVQQVVRQCIKGMLRPVVRLCLRNSLKLNEVIELLKIVFVQVAAAELKKSSGAASASRVSVMTGVHRKDVTRITASEGEFKPYDDTIAKVMVQWQHDRRFTTAAGKPRVLSAEGRESEFARLVESVNGGNLNAYAVRFEMERMGVIRARGNFLKLAWRDFSPEPSLEDGLQLLAADSDDLAGSVEQNLYERPGTPNLHLKTVFDDVAQSRVAEVRRWLLEEGSAFHRRARAFISQFDRDLNPKLREERGGARVVVGTFSLAEGQGEL